METKRLLNKKITQWLLLGAMLIGCSANVWADYGYTKLYLNCSSFQSWETQDPPFYADFYTNANCNDGYLGTIQMGKIKDHYYVATFSWTGIKGIKVRRNTDWNSFTVKVSDWDSKYNCAKVTDWGAASMEKYAPYAIGDAFDGWSNWNQMTAQGGDEYTIDFKNIGNDADHGQPFKFMEGNNWDHQGFYNDNWTVDASKTVGVTLYINPNKDGDGNRGNSYVHTLQSGYSKPVTLHINTKTLKAWAVATKSCTTPSKPTLTADASTVCTETTPTFKSTSETGASYQLYTSAGAASGSPVPGTGSQISLTAAAINSNTTFYVKACSTASGCTSSCSQSDNVEISTTSAPTSTSNLVTTDDALVEGETITLKAPTTGWGGGAPTSFIWMINGENKGEGTSTYGFTIPSTSSFTAFVYGKNSCGQSSGASPVATFSNIQPACTPPTAQNVSLSGCSVVAMDDSQSGYTYTLYKGDDAVAGSDWAGDGNAHSWSVTTTGTYTVKAKETATGGCLTAMSGSANVTKLGAVVTPSLSLSNIHPYEVLTLTADKSVSWSLSNASATAYISADSGISTIFKGAVGTYTITATADGCNTATNFTVKIDDDNCN